MKAKVVVRQDSFTSFTDPSRSTLETENKKSPSLKTKEANKNDQFYKNNPQIKSDKLPKHVDRRIAFQGPRIITKRFTQVRCVNIGQLVSSTHFNVLEVALMLEIFSCLTQRNSKPMEMTQYLENTVLRQFLIENFCITDENALLYVVTTISNFKAYTSPTDFVQNFSTYLRGNLRERAEFVFKTFDKDRNGYLTKMVEFMNLMTDIFDVNIAADNPSTDPEQPLRETIEYLMKKFDKNKRGEISFEDFFEAIQEEPLLMECCFSVFPSAQVSNTFQTIFLYPYSKANAHSLCCWYYDLIFDLLTLSIKFICQTAAFYIQGITIW